MLVTHGLECGLWGEVSRSSHAILSLFSPRVYIALSPVHHMFSSFSSVYSNRTRILVYILTIYYQWTFWNLFQCDSFASLSPLCECKVFWSFQSLNFYAPLRSQTVCPTTRFLTNSFDLFDWFTRKRNWAQRDSWSFSNCPNGTSKTSCDCTNPLLVACMGDIRVCLMSYYSTGNNWI